MIKIESVYDKISKNIYPEDVMKILEEMHLASFDYDYDKIADCANRLRK